MASAAFEPLMAASYRKVYNAAYRLAGNRADAEDLTQEAFVRAYRAFDTYDRTKSFDNWMLRIVTRLFLDLSRYRHRRPRTLPLLVEAEHEAGSTELTFEPSDPSPTPEDSLRATDLGERCLEALESIKREYRAAFELVVLRERPVREAAAELGIPESTVRSRLYRARLQLRELLNPLAP